MHYGLTRPDLAALIGSNERSIYFYERGEHKISATRLAMIGKALDKPLTYFIEAFPEGDILPTLPMPEG